MEDVTFSQSANKAWFVILLVIAASVALYFYTDNDWFLIVLVPLVPFVIWGSWSGRFIVAGISGMRRHASRQALGKWQGNYYQWDNQHIRVYESGDDVWIVDKDLIHAAGMNPDAALRRKLKISYGGYRKIPGTKFEGFNEKAVLQFLLNKQENNPDVTRLKLWLEREVFATLRRKREGK